MWVLSKGTILASFCVNSSISLSLSYIWLFSTPFGLVKMDPPMEAERTNGETLICQGCQRFETSVFFSEKINISTTGGSRVGFFQPDTNHP